MNWKKVCDYKYFGLQSRLTWPTWTRFFSLRCFNSACWKHFQLALFNKVWSMTVFFLKMWFQHSCDLQRWVHLPVHVALNVLQKCLLMTLTAFLLSPHKKCEEAALRPQRPGHLIRREVTAADGFLRGFLSWLPDSWTALTAADFFGIRFTWKRHSGHFNKSHCSDIKTAAFSTPHVTPFPFQLPNFRASAQAFRWNPHHSFTWHVFTHKVCCLLALLGMKSSLFRAQHG